jgi:hypothetical protein
MDIPKRENTLDSTPEMDSSKPLNTVPSTPTSPVSPSTPSTSAYETMSKTEEEPPVSPPIVTQHDSTPPSAHKKPLGLMLGILLFLIIVFLGILFFFVFNKSVEEQEPIQQVPVEDLQPSPTSSITPTPELTEEGVDSIDIGSPEASLSPIQNDIEKL